MAPTMLAKGRPAQLELSGLPICLQATGDKSEDSLSALRKQFLLERAAVSREHLRLLATLVWEGCNRG